MAELGKKRNPGILGYDPAKAGKDRAVVQYHCPHCWFAHRNKSVLGRHIKQEHWDLAQAS